MLAARAKDEPGAGGEAGSFRLCSKPFETEPVGRMSRQVSDYIYDLQTCVGKHTRPVRPPEVQPLLHIRPADAVRYREQVAPEERRPAGLQVVSAHRCRSWRPFGRPRHRFDHSKAWFG